mgnify:CR=1 FL=1
MKKMNAPGGPVMKPLAELTLLDRFLFACVMEDRGTMELVLSIILGEEIRLAGQPQAEREMRPGCVPSGWMCILWMRRTVFTMRKYRKRIPVI